MHKTPITNSISANEMREMRRSGMTNKQIAQALDISVSTVYNHIGKKSQDVAWTGMEAKPTADFTSTPNTVALDYPKIDRHLRIMGISRRGLADAAGISHSTVNAWFSRRADISEKYVEPICKALGLPREVIVKQPEPSVEEPTVEESVEKEVEEPVKESKLELVREVKIIDLKGALCTYHVDQRSGDVELGGDKENSIVYGMVSGDMLDRFIEELTEIRSMLKGA